MNKRASSNDSFNILNYTLRIIFIGVLMVTFYVFFTALFTFNLESQNVVNKVFEKRFLYSDTLFVYKNDAIGRVYPGIIDIKKFDEQHINEAFVFEKSYIAAKCTLKNSRTNEKKELYLNKKWFDRWYPYTAFEEYDKYTLRRFVLIENEGKFDSGLLEIEVVYSNPGTEKTEVLK
ncbi:MAG: hypothetical protein V1859_06090 [archaeon]